MAISAKTVNEVHALLKKYVPNARARFDMLKELQEIEGNASFMASTNYLLLKETSQQT